VLKKPSEALCIYMLNVMKSSGENDDGGETVVVRSDQTISTSLNIAMKRFARSN